MRAENQHLAFTPADVVQGSRFRGNDNKKRLKRLILFKRGSQNTSLSAEQASIAPALARMPARGKASGFLGMPAFHHNVCGLP